PSCVRNLRPMTSSARFCAASMVIHRLRSAQWSGLARAGDVRDYRDARVIWHNARSTQRESGGQAVAAGDKVKPDLLIVDDDPLITDTLNFVLSKDFSVYVAESRGIVKSLLRQLDAPPKLALVDLGLPPTPHRPDEGFKLINELVAGSPTIKI